MANQFRRLQPQYADTREIAEVTNSILNGKLNCTGSITLATTGTETTLYNERIGYDSVIMLMPRNANAAGETDHVYIKSKAIGSCVIGHRQHGHSDCNWDYVIIG
jgi:hypothetical protein